MTQQIMTTRHRTDHNQVLIVEALRAIGASVTILAGVGQGCPDLLVGWHGSNILLEIKNLQGRGNRMTPAEVDWIERWEGQVGVITSIEDAIAVVQEADESNR